MISLDNNLFLLCLVIISTICRSSSIKKKTKKSNTINEWSILSDEARQKIRLSGRCVKGCGFGYYDQKKSNKNETAIYSNKDNKSNYKYKSIYEFNDLLIRNDDFVTKYNNAGLDVNEGELALDLDSIFLYCTRANISFEECVGNNRDALINEQADECYVSCMKKVETDNAATTTEKATIVDFQDSAAAQQALETCLDDFSKAESLEFDYHDFQSSSDEEEKNNLINKMWEQYKKTGFVIIENLFPQELMEDVTSFLNAWNKIGSWDNLELSDFAFDENTANRFVLLLPYKEPFMSLVSSIQSLVVIKEFLKKSNNNDSDASSSPRLDVVAAIGSLPGAINQEMDRSVLDKGHELILNLIPHDMKKENSPSSFCPCTHDWPRLLKLYALQDECPISYEPDYLKAGSMIISEGSLAGYSIKNYGDIVRWNVEMTYLLDDKDHLLPPTEKLKEHMEKYRSTSHL